MNRFLFASLLLAVCLIQSCKEGCKDKTAINYDSKASAENGTCLYCKSTFTSDTGLYFFTAPNAPNPNANAIEFILVSTNATTTGNGCQTEGKKVQSICNNYLRIVNLTNVNADGQFNVEYFQNGTFTWFFQDNNFIVLGPPGSGTDTLNFGLVDSTACSNISIGTMSPNLNSLQFF